MSTFSNIANGHEFKSANCPEEYLLKYTVSNRCQTLQQLLLLLEADINHGKRYRVINSVRFSETVLCLS